MAENFNMDMFSDGSYQEFAHLEYRFIEVKERNLMFNR